jgi:hypothetical protein
MGAVDFTDWAIPDLVITLGGREYRLAPPSVARARPMLALVVGAEIKIGLAKGPLPDELATLHDEVAGQPLAEVALGTELCDQMEGDGLPRATIDRVAYYALFHWIRGKDRADAIAQVLWAPRDGGEPVEDAQAPKG